MKKLIAGLVGLCALSLAGCGEPEPHELEDAEQRAWARQAIEEHYDYEGELVALVNTGIDSSANYCAAAMVFEEEEGSLEGFWDEESFDELDSLIPRDDLLARLHVGYGTGCPDVFEQFLERQNI